MGPCLLIVCCLSMPLALDVQHARQTHTRQKTCLNRQSIAVNACYSCRGERCREICYTINCKIIDIFQVAMHDACLQLAHIRQTTWRTHPKKIDWRTKRPKENTQNENYVTVNWNVVNADDAGCLVAWLLSVAGIRHIVANACASERSQHWNTLTLTHTRPHAVNFQNSFENQNCPTVDDRSPFAREDLGDVLFTPIVFIEALILCSTFCLRMQLMQCLNSVAVVIDVFIATRHPPVFQWLSQGKIDFVCCVRPMSKKRKLAAHIEAKLFRCFVIV